MPYMPRDSDQRSSAYADTGRIGFIYALQNPSFSHVLKLGCTRKHPLSRAKELSASTGVPEDYKLVYYLSFGDCFLAESLIHDHFATRRINESREFFEVGITEAISFIETLGASAEYREGVAGQEEALSVSGGEWVEPLRRAWADVAATPTPFADLFASFDPDGPAELTEEEQAKCRALERRSL